MRESDHPKVLRRGIAGMIILLLLLLLLGAFAPAAMAADWPRCVDGCSANDVEVNSVWLEVSGGCEPGDTVTAEVWMNLWFHAQNRYCIVVVADLYEDGYPIQSNWTSDIIGYNNASGNYSYKMGTVNWTCGKTFEMKNILVMWRQNDPGAGGCSGNCTDYTTPSKCTKQPSIIVVTPLVADFEATTVCYCTDTQFTNKTTGGLPPYTFDWNFGDSTPHNITENPSHHYNAAGTYNVTLTVTDSNTTPNTDSQSYNVTVWPTPVVDFTTTPQPQIYCLPITFNGSADWRNPRLQLELEFQ
jgi:hypothetical protein